MESKDKLKMSFDQQLTLYHKNNINIGKLTPSQKEYLEMFLSEEMHKFSKVEGRISYIEHEIRLKDETPIKQRYTPRNPALQAIINEEVDKMIAILKSLTAHGVLQSL
ncbi:hypothetical protein HHI36_015278 [Cryptolaemus montrouzieri]|uniref:Uncharacterized protein n=1 Tax=Cryptolaemus montrouzieri TaxID=559131 RepID=A0ABD2N5Y9_9CUCU